MPRPSRRLDETLLDTGLALLPETGCRGLSVRRLTATAGVNLGMFHYHFGSKERFVRAVLARVYESMFAELVVRSADRGPPLEGLRASLLVIGRFAAAHTRLLVRLVADAMAGEPLAAEFLQSNLPRHVAVMSELVARAQAAGAIAPAPRAQLLSFMFGAVAGPLLIGATIRRSGLLPDMLAHDFDGAVLSDAALAQRVELVIRALAIPDERRGEGR